MTRPESGYKVASCYRFSCCQTPSDLKVGTLSISVLDSFSLSGSKVPTDVEVLSDMLYPFGFS